MAKNVCNTAKLLLMKKQERKGREERKKRKGQQKGKKMKGEGKNESLEKGGGHAFRFFSGLAYHSDILLELCLLLVCITLAKSGFNAVKTCLGVRRFKRKTWKHRLAALKHGNSIAHGSWICVAKNVCNTAKLLLM